MKFVQYQRNANNKIVGEFKATGIRPHFLDQIIEIGIEVDNKYFDPTNKL